MAGAGYYRVAWDTGRVPNKTRSRKRRAARPGPQIDIFVITTSLFGIVVPQLRLFRSLRTLRLVTRIKQLEKVVQALCQAIPVLGTVCVVLGFIWFMFAVLGVQLMMGRYWACIDLATGEPTSMCAGQRGPAPEVNLSHRSLPHPRVS